MFTFGIYTLAQYQSMGEQRRFFGARVAYNLLRLDEDPSPEDVRSFEDICITLQTSNGTFRTTFHNRFRDVDSASLRWMGQFYRADQSICVQDRAVSSGLTSAEWARSLYEHFPAMEFEASDLLAELLELSPGNGEIWITEPGGAPLQYIRPPFVVSLQYPESWRNPILRGVAALARKRFARVDRVRCRIRPISCIHPEARVLSKTNPNFRFVVRSVFDRTPGVCHVLRTMNILNLSYFSREQLLEGASNIFDSLQPGGIWIVGRTMEDDFTNHATFFRRGDHGWEILERIGKGSEIEALALAARVTA